MSLFPPRSGSGRGSLRTLVRSGVAALLLLGGAPALAAESLPASDTVPLVNRVTARYQAENGLEGSASASVTIGVDRPTGVRVEPSHEVAVVAGERRVLAHRVVNLGAAAGRFGMSLTVPEGWRVELYVDQNGDGRLGATEPLLGAPLLIPAGGSASLLLVVDVPDTAAEEAARVRVTATEVDDPSLTASAVDVLTVRAARRQLSIEKRASRDVASSGDTLRYSIVVTNRGEAALSGAVVSDRLPAGVRYVPGSLRLASGALTDAADADRGEVVVSSAGEAVVVRLADLAPGAAVVLELDARVSAADGTIANVAVLAVGGFETATSPTETRVEVGRLEVTKVIVGADRVRVGDHLTYRIGYRNLSPELTLRELLLVDTLPAGLALVSAEGSPEVSGAVLRWRIPMLAPGASGSVLLVTRVESVPRGGTVLNRVHATAANAAATSAASGMVEVGPAAAERLEIIKRAELLEASAGDLVPFRVVVRNIGSGPIQTVVLRDRLPEGVRLIQDRVSGAGTVEVEGRELRMVLVGPLQAGEERVVRYAVALLSAESARSLTNRVWGEDPAGLLLSDTARASFRVRGRSPMQSRTVIGKVWVDLNGNGRQDPAEPGVRGVSLWSEDGEVVTTDRQGRFSFRQLRAGTHLLRLDPLTLPEELVVPERRDLSRAVRVDGWSTPASSFRVVPRTAEWATGSSPSATAATPPGGPARPGDDRDGDGDGAESAAGTPRIDPLRTEHERAREEGREFIDGPVVRIVAPFDGAVVPSNRIFVRVRGEAGAPVRLYNGAAVIAEAVLRPDGVADFVGVDVVEGPQRLRVSMVNSARRERWDSVSVHRSGEPARIQGPGGEWTIPSELRAPDPLRLRVLDRWEVPVAHRPYVTVEWRGVALDADDADRSSVGLQLRAAEDGSVVLPLRGAPEPGMGQVGASAGAARITVPLRTTVGLRPLIGTGAAQIGIGAAPEAFGALTLRGSIGSETAVTLSYDSRRGREEDDYFAGGYDPTEEGRYVTLGDGSRQRMLASGAQQLSARVERGADWVEIGDVTTDGFGGEIGLGGYQRALTGASGRIGAGPVALRGFGSVTDQRREERQLRGNGSSGPYRIGGAIRPGTERVAVEVRARENAARVIARTELTRLVEYQVDYDTGILLLQQPIPASDPQGNPVFLVVTAERRSGGRSEAVGGLRAELDLRRLLPASSAASAAAGSPGAPAPARLDSMGVAVFGIREGSDGRRIGSRDLVGGDVHLRHGPMEATGELIRSLNGDSIATAARMEAALALPRDRARLSASWLSVGDGFSSAGNPRLVSELEELRLAGDLRITGTSSVRVSHERQHFGSFGVERQSTRAQLRQTIAGQTVLTEAGVTDDQQATAEGMVSSSGVTARASSTMGPRAEVWVEGLHALSGAGGAHLRPDHAGAGLTYRLPWGLKAAGSYRRVLPADDSAAYSVTSIGLRAERIFGGSAWGALERADDQRASHMAVLGWNQRLARVGGWSLQSLFERRVGLSRAALGDPERGLPFLQAEQDRWSAGLGLEWLPSDSAGRFGARGELHGGERSGFRFDVAGDVVLASSIALLTRHDWSRDEMRLGPAAAVARRERSVLGIAVRPVHSDALNLLGKLEWRRTEDPFAGSDAFRLTRDESRLIASGDLVWSPEPFTELGARYAIRRIVAGQDVLLGSISQFFGARAARRVRGRLGARLDGRMLMEGASGTSLWSLAPGLLYRLAPELELEGGYRFGTLRDQDFVAAGGRGAYLNLGIFLTEGTMGSAADFWRERIRSAH